MRKDRRDQEEFEEERLASAKDEGVSVELENKVN